jgi:hypothetical protein
MRRRLRTACAVLLVTLSVSTPAYASLADWLDKLGELSGPGPWIQRVGLALDFACIEGQWWKDPLIDRTLDDSPEFELQVINALGSDRVGNPFKITSAIRDLVARTATSQRSTDPLIALFDANRNATLRVLRQRARSELWLLRERIFAAKGQPVGDVLRANGYDPNLLAQDVKLLEDSLKLAFNPFCVGDLRKHRLSVGVYTAWFTTDAVPATYVFDADRALLSPRINAYPIAVTLRTSLPFVSDAHPMILRSWDLGLSIGAIRFQPDDQNRFEPFWLGPYVEFPRITLRPLAGIACQVRNGNCPGQWTAWDLLEVELVRKSLPAHDRQQFGALPAPGSEREGQWWLRVGVSIKFNRDQTPETLLQ